MSAFVLPQPQIRWPPTRSTAGRWRRPWLAGDDQLLVHLRIILNEAGEYSVRDRQCAL
jgi:hypothetical protein